MKKWFPENFKFKITVTQVGGACRNGHEVGDAYECGYGLPGGFCSKTAPRLFSIQEAVRSGGDLRTLIYGADKHSCMIPCADHVVTFKIEAELNFTIKPLTKEHLLDFCKDKLKALGGSKITIGIIEENILLKSWYMVNEFVHTGTKKFNWQPFTISCRRKIRESFGRGEVREGRGRS